MIQSVYFRHQIIDRRYTGNDIRETGIIFSTENHHETHSDIVSDGRMQNTWKLAYILSTICELIELNKNFSSSIQFFCWPQYC